MNREKSLVKNLGVLSIGTFLPKLLSFVTLPILTAYLTKEDYGTYDFVCTIVSLLLPAVTLQIQSAAFRFLIECRNDLNKTKSVISNMLVFTFSVSLASIIVVFLCIQSVRFWIRIEIVLYFFIDILLATVQQITRGLGKNMAYSISAVISSVANFIVIYFAVYCSRQGLFGVLLALVFSVLAALVYLVISIKLWKYIDFQLLSKVQLISLLKYSWPMVPNNLSSWVLAASDRIVITAVLGVEANAVYAVANKIPNLLKILQSTFTYAWQENASIAVNDNDSNEYYSNMFDTMFSFLSAAVAGILLFLPIIFNLLIRGDYNEAYVQIPILLIAFMLNCMAVFMGGIYVAHMKTLNVGITTVVAAIINLLIDIVFVNKIGIYAGSISTLVSYAVLLIYRMVDAKKMEDIHYNYLRLFVQLVLLVLMSCLSVRHSIVSNVLNLCAFVLIVFYYNKKIMSVAFKTVMRKLKIG